MNRESFIRSRRADWQELERLQERLQKTSVKIWRAEDITRMSALYRSVCYDLSLVRSREWGARLETYLNDLVAAGHNRLYRSPPKSFRQAVDFILRGFPRLLRHYYGCFWLAAALFVIPFVAGVLIGQFRPELAEYIAGAEGLEESRKMYSTELYQQADVAYADERASMAGFYIWNNIGIAFRAFALGVFFGVGTVLVLLFNGMFIGLTSGYLGYHGLADNFYSFAISHGSFELTAIVVAGAAGLLLGQGILRPGNRTRWESLRVQGMDAVRLAAGAGVMLLVAALIEAFFSPSPLPHTVKYAVGSALWILVILWLTLAGREVTHEN